MEKQKKRSPNRQGEQTKSYLIKVAMKCLADEGVHNVSFHSIAREAKVDQPLVVYHFKKKENIFLEVWNYIYQEAIKEAETVVKQASHPQDKILQYIDTSIRFFTSNHRILIVYIQLHFLSIYDEKIRQINTEIKRKAVNRLAQIIMGGQQEGYFIESLDPYLTSKTIHSSLVGIGINSVTEFPDFELEQILATFKNQTLRSLQKI